METVDIKIRDLGFFGPHPMKESEDRQQMAGDES
jgi:hypothetical protein